MLPISAIDDDDAGDAVQVMCMLTGLRPCDDVGVEVMGEGGEPSETRSVAMWCDG